MSKLVILDGDSPDARELIEATEAPARQTSATEQTLDEIAEKLKKRIPALAARESFVDELEAAGAGKKQIAQTLASELAFGDTSASRLQAASLAMKAHGVLDPISNNSTPISFNIAGGHVNLQAILQPPQKELSNE